MCIPYSITIVDPISSPKALRIQTIITNTFEEIHRICDNWNPSSELCSLTATTHRIPISTTLQTLFACVTELYEQSGHRFDPTVSQLAMLWKNAALKQQLPTSEQISEASQQIGWDAVHVEEGVFWSQYSLSIDLCGIAKGYAVDLLIERLQSEGICNALVNWGGEIKAIGHAIHHRPWTIGIENTSFTTTLCNESIATSGTYQQQWHIEEQPVSHIINPHTQQPLTGNEAMTQVSVKTASCMLADGLATTLLLFTTQEEAREWMNRYYPHVEIWFNEGL